MLDEVGDLLDERLVGADRPPALRAARRELLLDRGAPLGRVDDDERLAQLRDVVLGRALERDGLGRQEAVAVGDRPLERPRRSGP